MRRNFRFREAMVRNGQRHDWIQPKRSTPAGCSAWACCTVWRRDRPHANCSPAAVWPESRRRRQQKTPSLPATGPDRPLEPDDAELFTRWMREDTEISYPEGRFPHSPVAFGQMISEIAKAQPPSWPRFGIVLRENDELIGANGLEDLDLLRRTGWTETEDLAAGAS